MHAGALVPSPPIPLLGASSSRAGSAVWLGKTLHFLSSDSMEKALCGSVWNTVSC